MFEDELGARLPRINVLSKSNYQWSPFRFDEDLSVLCLRGVYRKQKELVVLLILWRKRKLL